MQTIRTKFREVKDKPENENLPTLDCFSAAIHGQGYNERALRRAFHRLVDKREYDRADERDIIDHLLRLTIQAL